MVGTVKKSTDTVDLTMVAILLIPSPLLSSDGSHEPIQYHAPLLQVTMRTLNIQRKLGDIGLEGGNFRSCFGYGRVSGIWRVSIPRWPPTNVATRPGCGQWQN